MKKMIPMGDRREILKILRRAQGILLDPSVWVQFDGMAKDKEGYPTKPEGPNVAKYTLLGAIYSEAEKTQHACGAFQFIAASISPESGYSLLDISRPKDIARWSNAVNTSHADLMTTLQRATEHCVAYDTLATYCEKEISKLQRIVEDSKEELENSLPYVPTFKKWGYR